MTGPRIGLSLGSGVARGWAQLAPSTHWPRPARARHVSGTSIGSLVGAAYVAGRLTGSGSGRWRDLARDCRADDVRLSGGGLIDGKLIVAFLQGLGIAGPIESYAKKYAAVATDLVTGREIWLQSGPIHRGRARLHRNAGDPQPGQDWRPMAFGRRPFQSGPGLGLPRPWGGCDHRGQPQQRPPWAALRQQAERPSRGGAWACCEQVPRSPAAAPAGGAARAGDADDPASSSASVGGAGIFRRDRQLHQHHVGPDHPHASRGRTAACDARPRLRDIGLLEFNRASEAIAEGRACVEHALPMLRRYV